jgi:4'-phosphopantetheinyl transferase
MSNACQRQQLEFELHERSTAAEITNSMTQGSFDLAAPVRGDIHLWLAYYDETQDVALHATYRALMNDVEQRQHQRFYFERDRNRYMVTRALVRTVLGRYLGIAPTALEFGTNDYGRPHVTNAPSSLRRLFFNLSHTHSLIVLGVAVDREIGVDVENIRDRLAPLEAADHFFAPIEATALRMLSAAGQPDRFFEYWTFKESYIKARGMGLSLPIHKFGFNFPSDDTVEIAIDAELGDLPQRWQFWQLRPRPEYLLAVCAERLPIESRLIVRQIVPTVTETLVEPLVLRRSANDRGPRVG